MAQEQFSNNAQTTLNGSITAGQTTITVNSNAGFPANAQFRILIDNEIMIVTAGQGGTTWTVTRGNSVPAPDTTTSATHANNATVTEILTAGALQNAIASPVAGAAWAASALLTLTTVANSYGLTLVGPSGAGTSFGVLSQAGTNSSDYSARFQTQALVDILAARGDGATVLGGNQIFSNATAKIIPGATNLTFTNNANGANNMVIADSGLTSFRNALIVPSAQNATIPTTGYGTLPVKIDDQLLVAPAASITFLNPLPTGFRHLLIEWYARGDNASTTVSVGLRFNNISTNTYDYLQVYNSSASAVTAIETLTTSSISIGTMAGSTATANYFGQGTAQVKYYQGVVGNKIVTAENFVATADTTTNQFNVHVAGKWRTTATSITRIDLIPSAGNFIAGSLFTLYGIP